MQPLKHLTLLITALLVFTACSDDSKVFTKTEETTKAPTLITTVIRKNEGDASATSLITAYCQEKGGVALYAGIDSNTNGVLDVSERFPSTADQPNPLLICNGSNGYTSLVSTQTVSTSSSCPTGGMEVFSGLDLNKNGTLDSNETTTISSICTDSNPLQNQDSTAPATLSGNIANFTTSRASRFSVISQEGGLWLTPNSIAASIDAHENGTNPVQRPAELIALDIDANGHYSAQVPSGTDYALTYIKGNLGQKVSHINLSAGETKTQDITSLSPNGGVKFTVVELGNANTKLQNATVKLIDLNTTTTSDENGTVEFKNIPSGDYSILVTQTNYVSKYLRVTIRSGITTNLQTIELSTTKGILTGSVTAKDTQGVALANQENIIVYAKATDGSVFTTITNSTGAYTFPALPVGDGYSVIASAHDYDNAKVDDINISENQTTTASALVLKKGYTLFGSITGYAKFDDKQAFNHAGIIVSIEGTDEEAITARDGSFILNHIKAGRYTVNFTDSLHATVTKSIVVVGGANSFVNDVELISAKGRLQGTVALVGVQNYSGVQVVFDGQTAYTNLLGQWNMILSESTHTGDIVYTHNDFQSVTTSNYEVSITASQDSVIPQGVVLQPKTGSLTGVVQDSDGQVLGGVTVSMNSESSEVTTNTSGVFKLNSIASGEQTLTIRKSGYLDTLNIDVNITAGTKNTLSTQQLTPIYLRGKVFLQGENNHSEVNVDLVGSTINGVVSDANGSFSFKAVPPGSYQVRFSKDNFISQTIPVAFSSQSDYTVYDVSLVKNRGILSGVVKRNASTNHSGISVVLDGQTALTNTNGEWSLSLPFGSYDTNITYSTTGYTQQKVASTFNINAGAITTIPNVTINSLTSSISGHVTDGANNLSGVDLFINGELVGSSDSSGDYTLSNIALGTQIVLAQKDGFGSDSISVDVQEGGVVASNLVLEPYKFSGEVNLEGQSNHSGILVSIGGQSDTTDANGAFEIAGINPGSYQLKLSASGYVGQTIPTVVGEGNYTLSDVFVLAQAKGKVRGLVQLENRGDHSGAIVQVTAQDGTQTQSITNILGEYSFILPEGNYTSVQVTHSMYASDTNATAFTVTQGDDTVRDTITLHNNQASIIGKVTDTQGNVFDQVTATFNCANGNYLEQVSVSGLFTKADVPVGDCTVSFTKAGYDSNSTSFSLTTDDHNFSTTPVTLKAHTFSGYAFLDGSSNSVNISVKKSGVTTTTNTDGNGHFSLEGLSEGNYEITFSQNTYTSKTILLYIPNSDYVLESNTTLTQAIGVLKGIAQLQGMTEHGGITVNVDDHTVNTDILGYWELELLEDDYATITYSKTNFTSKTDSATYTVVADDTTSVSTQTLALDTKTVTGQLKDDQGTPIVGATVSLNSVLGTITGLTGADGNYSLSGVPVATYDVSLYAAKHALKVLSVAVNRNVDMGVTTNVNMGVTTLDRLLFNGTAKIEGSTDYSSITLQLLNSDVPNASIDKDTGNFTFYGVGKGSYQLQVSHVGYVTKIVPVAIVDDTNYTLPYEIVLSKAEGELTGVVKLQGTNDYSGVVVAILDAGFSTATNALGQWTIPLPEGNYTQTIQYTKAGYVTQTNTNDFSIAQGQTLVDANRTLVQAVGNIQGNVVDTNGTVLQSVQVTVSNTYYTNTTNTNSSGGFSLAGIPIGTYTVSAQKEGYGVDSATVNVTVNSDTVLATALQLTPSQVIGSINMQDDVNCTNVTVELDGLTPQNLTNCAFTFTPVLSGTHTLTVSKTDYQTKTLTVNIVGNTGYVFSDGIYLEKSNVLKDYELLTWDFIKANNININDAKYNVYLPTTMPNGSSVRWSSNNPTHISSDGTLTIAPQTSNQTTVLTAIFSDRSKVMDTITTLADFEPSFKKSTTTVTIPEDFGYVLKTLQATNANGYPITYSFVSATGDDVLDALPTVNTNTGEIGFKSKANANGTATLLFKASSGGLEANKTITLVVEPVADAITAHAGEDQSITPDTQVTLDSSASIDIDGDANYSWNLEKPATSNASLSNTTAHNPTFTPDVTGTYTATLTMTNDAGSSSDSVIYTVLPTVSISDINVTEGNDAVFTVTVSAHDNNVTLDYNTADVTAEVFKDYQKTTGALTFVGGELSKTITVPVTIDHLPEATENFKIQLTNIHGAIQNTLEATASISYEPLSLFYLTGVNGFVVENLGGTKSSSTDISGIGDTNGDGIDDIVIGSSKETAGGKTYAGVSRVIFGSSSIGEYGSLDASTITNGAGAYKFSGSSTADYSGFSVSNVGNFNGTFVDYTSVNEVMIASPYEDPLSRSNAGMVFIINDRESNTLVHDDITSSYGYRIYGSQANDNLGYIVSDAGDFNGDGLDDVLVYASGAEKTYLIYGTSDYTTGVLDLNNSIGNHGIVIDGKVTSISNAGDINGDGYSDIILGDYTATTYAGKAYIIYGGSNVTNTITLSSLGSLGTIVGGVSSYNRAGYSVSALGDVNSDGYADVIIGTLYSDKSYVIFGSKNIHTTSAITLTNITSYGFTIYDNADNDSGTSVTGDVDINGDGISDIIISGPKGGVNSAGKVYVVYGDKNLGLNGTQFNLSEINGANGFEIDGVEANEKAGLNVRSAKDINGDGFDDILLSTYLGNKAYVIFGGDYTNEVTQKVLSFAIGTGSSDADVMVGSAGATDLIGKGGADVLLGGPGLDRIHISDLDFVKVDGKNGRNFLYFDFDGKDINLSSIKPEQIKNIETIDISGSGPNTLIFDDATIKNLKSKSQSSLLNIVGDADDKITFSDAGWSFNDDGTNRTYSKDGITINIDRNIGTLPELILSSNIEVLEDSGTAKIAIRRSNGLYTSTIDYSLTNGTAIAGTDFENTSGTITFYEGELIKDFTLTMIQDDKLEEVKSLTLSLDNPQNFNLPSGHTSTTISIKDDVIGLEYLDGTNGMRIHPAANYDGIGYSTSNAGDINGDGYEDMFIGGQGNENYIIFGNNSGVNISDFSLADLNSSLGLKIINGSYAQISSVGDVNGDGFDDVIISKPYLDSNGSTNNGGTYLIFGNSTLGTNGILDLNTLNSTEGIQINGIDTNDSSGTSVSNAGDINGDGYDDIIIGAYQADPNGNSMSGETYVIFGKASWTSLNLSNLDGSNGFIINGIDANDKSAFSVSNAGDYNGDGYDDIVIGAYAASGGGEAYVVFGASNVGSSGSLELGSLTSSTKGILINASSGAGWLGYSVAGGGDINGDGYDDVILGSQYSSPNALDLAGNTYILYGQNTSTTDVDLTTLDGANGFVIHGAFSYGHLGAKVANGGDINGDGYDDILLTALTSYTTSSEDAKVYAIYGGTITSSDYDLTELNTSVGFSVASSAAAYFGRGLSGEGDYNGDGFSDILIGAHYDGTTYDDGGEAYLINGRDFLGWQGLYPDGNGNENANNLTDTSNHGQDYYYYGRQGNDTYQTYFGPDYHFMGQGDDRINVYAFDVNDVGYKDMGRGFDTLDIFYGQHAVDFTTIPNNRLRGIEKLLIGYNQYGGSLNSHDITMGVDDVLSIMDTNQHTFYIESEGGGLTSNDVLCVDNVTITSGTWDENLSDGDTHYRTWNLSNSPIVLKISNNVDTITISGVTQ